MNAELLLAHYERIAEAPDAIARLRRFVLDLAVRGKLVPQDANDEPATELLKRIATERARLLKEAGFGQHEGDLPRSLADFPFAVPASWSWCYLDDIAGVARGGSPRPIKSFITDDPNGMPWIKIGDSTRGSIYIDKTEERIIPAGIARSRVVLAGDLLLSNSMSFGFPYITRIRGCIHDGWLVIRTARSVDKLYLHKVFLSGYARSQFSAAAAGAVVQNLNAEKARALPIPLPPLAEQHRIVAKVDELMALCDRLEAARTAREATRDRLAAVSLARLNTPDPETFPSDARFALDALPALTTRPDQIKHLRQTILNLAVRGKLVPQDPSDEAAAELHARLEARFAVDRVPAGRRSSRTDSAAGLIDEPAFPAPAGWVWARMGTLGDTNIGLTYSPADIGETGCPVLRSNNIQDGRIDLSGLVRVRGAPKSSAMVQIGDMLICARNGSRSLVGKAALIEELPEPMAFGAFMAIFRSPVNPYLHLFVSSPVFRQVIDEVNTTTINQLTQANLRSTLVPLPPLSEQHRIVAKVNELMALCDALEASLAAAITARTRLLEATLAEALAPTVATQDIAA